MADVVSLQVRVNGTINAARDMERLAKAAERVRDALLEISKLSEISVGLLPLIEEKQTSSTKATK